MSRFDESKAHYESLISLFKYIVTIALSLFTAFAFFIGYITYKDGQEMRDDLKARKAELREDANQMKNDAKEMKQDLKEREKNISAELQLLSDKVNTQITIARQDAINEISNIKNQASILAQSEARNKINEVFDNRNLNQFVEQIAEERIKPQINNLVDNKIAQNLQSETETAFQNLTSGNSLKVNQAIGYFSVADNLKLNEYQLKKITELIDDKYLKDSHKNTLNTILVVRNSPVTIAFYKRVLNDFAKTLEADSSSIQTILTAYQFFLSHNIEYDFMVEHLKTTIGHKDRPDTFIGLLPILCPHNKNYTLRLLNEKSLIDKFYKAVTKDSIYQHKDSVLNSMQSCWTKDEVSKTYFMQKKD